MSKAVSTCIWEYFPFIFTFSLVFVGVFSEKISAPPLSTSVSLSFSTYFCICIPSGRDFFVCKWSMSNRRLGNYFSLTCHSSQYLHRISYLFVLYASPSFGCWLYFFINSSCWTDSIQVSTVKLTP